MPHMRNQVLAALAVIIVLTACYVNVGKASPQASVTLQLSGTIGGTIEQGNSTSTNTVIMRGFTADSNNLTQAVDDWVGNYTFAPNMAVSIGDFHIDGILRYPTQFNASSTVTWGDYQWTFNQTEQVINEFHRLGWKVILGSTNIAWDGQWVQAFIQQNPELGFTDAKGYTANDALTNGTGNGQPSGNVAGNKTVGSNDLIPDLWANFTTSVPALGISNNTRLIDVLCTKLGQMITGGLSFDGFFGTDGWNGYNMAGYDFQYGSSSSSYYSFSYQEMSEWASDTQNGYGLPAIGQPSGWASWNITQRASWIIGNATAANQYYEWECNNFNNIYLQIKNTIVANNPSDAGFVGLTICGADGSSQWSYGNLGGAGLLNFTMVANSQSITLFQTDPEVTAAQIPQYDAYVNALITAKNPLLTASIGIQAMSWSDWSACSLSNMKEQYLSQVQNYVWYNGVRYPACNQTVFTIQYPAAPIGNINWAYGSKYPFWNNTAVHALFNFINSVQPLLVNSNPVYLGNNIFTIPDGGTNSFLGNSTTAIWQDVYNPMVITGGIYGDNNLATALIHIYTQAPTIAVASRFTATGNPTVNGIAAYTTGEVIFAIYSDNSGSIGTLLDTTSSASAAYPYGWTYAPLNTPIQLPTAYWLVMISDSAANNFNLYYASNTVTPNQALQFNISTVGEFPSTVVSTDTLYPGNNDLLIYAFNSPEYSQMSSPINSSNPQFDCKVFQSSNGTIAIPVLNTNDFVSGTPVTSTLTINTSALGLPNSPQDYSVYWADEPSTTYPLSSSGAVSVTLQGGTDVLVISPK
jgi:hypothetical protein